MQIPLYTIKNLLIQKGELRRLSVKSFDLHRGAVYVISGKPGSGKTTFIQSLLKDVKLNEGEILFEGKDIKSISKSTFQSELMYVPQTCSRNWGTVENYMLKIIGRSPHRKDNAKKHMEKIARQLNCTHLVGRKMRDLTPGQLRWVMIAAAIASDTKVMIIDEVEQHLTKDMLKTLNKILYRKCNHDGVSIILSTLNPDLLSNITSVSITLSDGRITSVRSSGKKNSKFKRN